jgi:hypothetical protein
VRRLPDPPHRACAPLLPARRAARETELAPLEDPLLQGETLIRLNDAETALSRMMIQIVLGRRAMTSIATWPNWLASLLAAHRSRRRLSDEFAALGPVEAARTLRDAGLTPEQLPDIIRRPPDSDTA